MKTISTLILLVFFIAGCSSVKVTSDYDPEYDFTKMKNYRWAYSDELNPNDVLKQYPLIAQRVQIAVDSVLQSKGYNLATDGDFDFVVITHAGSKEKMQVNQTGGGYYRGWYDPWWGPYGGGGTTTVSYYEEATLVIDFISWENKELAWRGMGTGTVKEHSSPESMQERIDDVVAKILAVFPSGSEPEE